MQSFSSLPFLADWLQRRIGSKWDKTSRTRPERGQWYNSPKLSTYVRTAISPETAEGVPGALRRHLGGRVLGRGISVGAGNGWKEIQLIEAGLVGGFDLVELSDYLAGTSRRLAAERGVADRVAVTVGDAFSLARGPYDLVYWDHALHHMMDVRAAVRWSVDQLAPGGVLVVNDYIGPTRLQWTWAETRLARAYIRAAEPHFGFRPRLRPRTPLDRWRMMVRDPSEAPQSDRILDACQEACGGFAPTPIGCALINICGSLVQYAEEENPAIDLLMEWDQKAKGMGYSHFAFGIWQKPA